MRELLLSMDSAELSEWQAWDRIHPLPDGGYWPAAMLAATVTNIVSAKGGRKASPADFLPHWNDAAGPAPELEAEEIVGLFQSIAKGQGV